MKSTSQSGSSYAPRAQANDDRRRWLERADQPHDPMCRPALERHDRKSHDVGVVLPNQPPDRVPDPILHENQIGDRDLMMPVDIAGQRAEGAVRHANRHRWHVLGGVRHR